VQILAVAEDMQGAEVVRPWVERAKARYPVVYDRENALGTLYRFKVVPIGILIDEEGRIVREASVIRIDDRQTWEALEQWVTCGTIPESWAIPEAQISPLSQKTPVEAEARFRLGRILFEQGRRDEAITEIRKAFNLDPASWIIRKQIWAIEHPERFYTGPVDYGWQKEQIERENADLGGVGDPH
jgi:tetratricopeptide (TPR) repeat protein